MIEFCPDCQSSHDPNQPCQDPSAQMRRLERLRKREVEAVERLAAAQTPPGSLLSFPHEAFKLLPKLISEMKGASNAELACRACDIVDATVAEAAKRWLSAPKGWEPVTGGPHG